MFKDNLKRFRKARKAQGLTGDGGNVMRGCVGAPNALSPGGPFSRMAPGER